MANLPLSYVPENLQASVSATFNGWLQIFSPNIVRDALLNTASDQPMYWLITRMCEIPSDMRDTPSDILPYLTPRHLITHVFSPNFKLSRPPGADRLLDRPPPEVKTQQLRRLFQDVQPLKILEQQVAANAEQKIAEAARKNAAAARESAAAERQSAETKRKSDSKRRSRIIVSVCIVFLFFVAPEVFFALGMLAAFICALVCLAIGIGMLITYVKKHMDGKKDAENSPLTAQPNASPQAEIAPPDQEAALQAAIQQLRSNIRLTDYTSVSVSLRTSAPTTEGVTAVPRSPDHTTRPLSPSAAAAARAASPTESSIRQERDSNQRAKTPT